MQEFSREVLEQLLGGELKDGELERVRARFRDLGDYERTLSRLDLANEEPVTQFSRERSR